MNRPSLALAAGVAVAVAAVALVRALWPPAPGLAALRARLAPHASAPPGAGLAAVAARLAAGDAGARLAARYARELRATGTTVPELLARALAAGAGGLVAGSVLAALAGLPPGPAALAALGLAAAGALAPVVRLRRGAERARRDLRHAVTEVVSLVGVCLGSGRSVEEAVHFATDAGDGPAFAELRSAVVQAPLVGRTVWEALDALAGSWDLPELAAFAADVERAAVVGASVADTVAVQAQAMRERALDELERAADAANLRMLAPTYLFVAGFLAFLLYPLLARLSGL